MAKTAVAADAKPPKLLRVIALEEQVRQLDELVALVTDEMRTLVHSGWSSLNQKRALGFADSADRRARELKGR